MHDQFSNSQTIRKPAVASKGGIVAAQSRKAAEVGAAVLAAGGDCMDAVVATGFALASVAWGAPLPQTASCYSCHRDHTAVEQTFVQFYPALMDVARRFNTVKPEYHEAAPR